MATTSFIRQCFLLVLFVSVFLLCEARPSFQNGTNAVLTNDAGNVTVQDATGDAVAQGSASDGAGTGGVIATLWVVCALIIGLPLATAGLRLGRCTSGLGLGLGLAVGIWASIINTVDNTGIPDAVVFALTVGIFVVGFVIGLVAPEYGIGATTLGICGGLSVGLRLAVLKAGLLIPVYTINWIIICVFGVAGVMLVIWRERLGVILGSVSAGTFLLVLGLDLLINKQSGMSRGLRFLFDRNSSHISDIFSTGYHPPISTTVLICISYALIPLLCYAQHKLFPGPFRAHRHRPSSVLSTSSDLSNLARPSFFARLTGRKGVPVPSHDSADVEKHAEVNAESTTALITALALDEEKRPSSPVSPSSALMQEVPEANVLLKGEGVAEDEKAQRT